MWRYGTFTENYAFKCFDPHGKVQAQVAMTIFVTRAEEVASPTRGLLPLWGGVAIYVLLIAAGNRLLFDPDTMWQITVGQWILDHRAVPETDIYSFTMRGQPWLSTQWLAQVMYAKAFSIAGWAGVVVLAASAITATFILLATFLNRRLRDSTTLVLMLTAFALTAGHLLARPHVLAMPALVAWMGGLIAAADQRDAPSFWLLPLIALWSNLHGGFIFGLIMVVPVALDAVAGAEAGSRVSLALRWAVFGFAALLASCCTPYGWNALLASLKILALGSALPLRTEWRPTDFGTIGAFEIVLLLGLGLALYRGVILPPTRILLLIGLLHVALAQRRAAEMLALVAPLVLAVPLAKQIGGREGPASTSAASVLFASIAAALLGGTFAFASIHRFEPPSRNSPMKAVVELKELNLKHVLTITILAAT